MATPAERMRALRERARRGVRRLTIDVREGDLRTIAERGYEGAETTDLDQQAQSVGLFQAALPDRSPAAAQSPVPCAFAIYAVTGVPWRQQSTRFATEKRPT
jgi:hypothetical protein